MRKLRQRGHPANKDRDEREWSLVLSSYPMWLLGLSKGSQLLLWQVYNAIGLSVLRVPVLRVKGTWFPGITFPGHPSSTRSQFFSKVELDPISREDTVFGRKNYQGAWTGLPKYITVSVEDPLLAYRSLSMPASNIYMTLEIIENW